MTKAKRIWSNILTAQMYALRSDCWVMVGAVLVASDGGMIIGGWNHPGPKGMGQHAEHYALLRLRKFWGSKHRIVPSEIVIAKFNGKKWLKSPPCDKCRRLIKAASIYKIRYFNGDEWTTEAA